MFPQRRKHNSKRVKERKPQDARSLRVTGAEPPEKKCLACGNVFAKSPKLSWRQWDDMHACSRGCAQQLPVSVRLTTRHRVTEAGCWEWTGSKDKDGYGRLVVTRDKVRVGIRAHRAAYETFVGPCPADMLVMHECDNPACVRPDHLRLGTTADNMADKMAKGRHRNQYGAC